MNWFNTGQTVSPCESFSLLRSKNSKWLFKDSKINPTLPQHTHPDTALHTFLQTEAPIHSHTIPIHSFFSLTLLFCCFLLSQFPFETASLTLGKERDEGCTSVFLCVCGVCVHAGSYARMAKTKHVLYKDSKNSSALWGGDNPSREVSVGKIREPWRHGVRL